MRVPLQVASPVPPAPTGSISASFPHYSTPPSVIMQARRYSHGSTSFPRFHPSGIGKEDFQKRERTDFREKEREREREGKRVSDRGNKTHSHSLSSLSSLFSPPFPIISATPPPPPPSASTPPPIPSPPSTPLSQDVFRWSSCNWGGYSNSFFYPFSKDWPLTNWRGEACDTQYGGKDCDDSFSPSSPTSSPLQPSSPSSLFYGSEGATEEEEKGEGGRGGEEEDPFECVAGAVEGGSPLTGNLTREELLLPIHKGVIKYFNGCYGFISPEVSPGVYNEESEIFFHRNDVIEQSFFSSETLQVCYTPGQVVQYHVIPPYKNKKKAQAGGVRLCFEHLWKTV